MEENNINGMNGEEKIEYIKSLDELKYPIAQIYVSKLFEKYLKGKYELVYAYVEYMDGHKFNYEAIIYYIKSYMEENYSADELAKKLHLSDLELKKEILENPELYADSDAAFEIIDVLFETIVESFKESAQQSIGDDYLEQEFNYNDPNALDKAIRDLNDYEKWESDNKEKLQQSSEKAKVLNSELFEGIHNQIIELAQQDFDPDQKSR